MKETERAIVGLEECYRLLDCIGTQEECKKLVLNAIDALKEKEVKEQISDAIHETAKQFRQTIVRCRDCKKRNQHHECEYGYHTDNWFCGDGEMVE